MTAVEVKLCGLRVEQDVRGAVRAGADHIGIVLVPGARRMIAPAWAARLVRVSRDAARQVGRFEPIAVGVVGGVDPQQARVLVEGSGVEAVQIVGDEESAHAIADAVAGYPIIRALSVPHGLDQSAVLAIELASRQWEARGARVLYDAAVAGQLGGTGTPVDIDTARQLLAPGNRGIAGGLDPETVGSIVLDLSPALVDVSSGIERTDGMKDSDLMRAFVAAARAGRVEHAPEARP